MPHSLIVTKFHRPAPRRNRVIRARLLEQLDAVLNSDRRLVLVSAPAGFGKTALAAEWASRQSIPLAWVSLDETDSDPVRFFDLLIAALQQIRPQIGAATAQLLHSQTPPPLTLLCALLINDLAEADTPLILVLDDYHLIGDSPANQAMSLLIERLPSAQRIILLSREDPPMPLARLRARNQMAEIREGDLRFTLDEAAAFFTETMGLRLTPDAVRTLAERTEGWITALQLAALALQSGGMDADRFVASFAGSDRYIVDYLMSEVLEHQPDDVRQFLRRTSVLERFNAPLCSALTEQADSQAMLDGLETANLFLVPLDHQREWYRYTRIFAEFLRSTLKADEQAALHELAMRWHEANGYIEQAIVHATASGALPDLERLVLSAAEGTLQMGRIVSLQSWLSAFPADHLRVHPALATYQGWVALFTGDLATAASAAQTASAAAESAHEYEGIADKLLILRAYLAIAERDDEAVLHFASAALNSLPPDHIQWRLMAHWALAEAQERTRPITEAIASLEAARRIGGAANQPMFSTLIESSLIHALAENGRLRDAAAYCHDVLARCDAEGRGMPITAILYARLAQLDYEADDLTAMREHFERFESMRRALPSAELDTLAHGIQIRLLAAEGRIAPALAVLRHDPGATGEAPSTALSDSAWATTEEVNLRLKQGDLGFAAAWAEAGGWSPDNTPEYLRIHDHLTYARYLIETDLEGAQRWLARLEQFADEYALYRRLLTVYLLQALAADREGAAAPVLRERLAKAIHLAESEGCIRAFLDESPRLLALLPMVRHLAPSFVDRILDHERPPDTAGSAASRMIDPPSERELEVLRLIAAGLSNAEIAERLVIATGTVKRHINNLYDKLGVSSRTQAVVRAGELNLL